MTVNTSPPDPVYLMDALRALWDRWRYRKVRIGLSTQDMAVLSAGEVPLSTSERDAFEEIMKGVK